VLRCANFEKFVATKEAAEKLVILCERDEKRPSAAKAAADVVGFMRGLKPRLPLFRVFPQPVKPTLFYWPYRPD
jgi:hypothetical protein